MSLAFGCIVVRITLVTVRKLDCTSIVNALNKILRKTLSQVILGVIQKPFVRFVKCAILAFKTSMSKGSRRALIAPYIFLKRLLGFKIVHLKLTYVVLCHAILTLIYYLTAFLTPIDRVKWLVFRARERHFGGLLIPYVRLRILLFDDLNFAGDPKPNNNTSSGNKQQCKKQDANSLPQDLYFVMEFFSFFVACLFL